MMANKARSSANCPIRPFCPGGNTSSLKGLAHGPESCIEAVVLRVTRGRSRAWDGSPVIQHKRKVRDPFRFLGYSQRQIMVLRTLEAWSKSANLLEQAPSYNKEMSEVHLAEQRLGR